jgi:TPR repeat protein
MRLLLTVLCCSAVSLIACSKADVSAKSESGSRLATQIACGDGDQGACAAHLAGTQKRCDSGDVDGCVLLGITYQTGALVATDESKAVAIFRKACADRSGAGCFELGVAIEHGRGTPRDLSAARDAYDHGCIFKYNNACVFLAELYGRPGELHDSKKALAAYDAACAIPYRHGCEQAARLRAEAAPAQPK